jgi:hypothetical protein
VGGHRHRRSHSGLRHADRVQSERPRPQRPDVPRSVRGRHPQGVNPATLAQGQKTTGKVYFDVTGDAPDTGVYSAGDQDLLAWAQAVATPRQGGTQWSPPVRSQASPAPAATPATPGPGGPRCSARPPAAGVRGSPQPGAPLPAGSQGTPLPPGSQGAPALAPLREHRFRRHGNDSPACWQPRAARDAGDDGFARTSTLTRRYEWLDHHAYSSSKVGPCWPDWTSLRTSMASSVHATIGRPSWTPRKSTPLVLSGVVLRRHGPGD